MQCRLPVQFLLHALPNQPHGIQWIQKASTCEFLVMDKNFTIMCLVKIPIATPCQNTTAYQISTSLCSFLQHLPHYQFVTLQWTQTQLSVSSNAFGSTLQWKEKLNVADTIFNGPGNVEKCIRINIQSFVSALSCIDTTVEMEMQENSRVLQIVGDFVTAHVECEMHNSKPAIKRIVDPSKFCRKLQQLCTVLENPVGKLYFYENGLTGIKVNVQYGQVIIYISPIQ